MATDSEEKGEESWWSKQKKEAASFNLEECPECRYIAGFGMYGAAVYVAHTGVKRQRMRGASLLGAVPALLTSALLVGMGTARLMRINPFSKDGSELGVEAFHKAIRKFQSIGAPAKPGQQEPER